jgi:hypothetical protein
MRFVGMSPLRMNRFSAEMLTGTSGKLTKEKLLEDAYTRSYKDEKGYYIPGIALKTTICFGGKRVKVGRSGASSQLRAVLHIEPKIYLDKKYKPEIIEGCVQIPARSGNRVLKYWVCFPEWSIQFKATLLDDRFPSEAIVNSANEAGLYYGLLDGRPEYGRFCVEDYKKLKP